MEFLNLLFKFNVIGLGLAGSILEDVVTLDYFELFCLLNSYSYFHSRSALHCAVSCTKHPSYKAFTLTTYSNESAVDGIQCACISNISPSSSELGSTSKIYIKRNYIQESKKNNLIKRCPVIKSGREYQIDFSMSMYETEPSIFDIRIVSTDVIDQPTDEITLPNDRPSMPIHRPFPHLKITQPSGKATLSIEMKTQPSEKATQPNEMTKEPSEMTTLSDEMTTQSSEMTTLSYEMTTQSSEMAILSNEMTTQPSEMATLSDEMTSQLNEMITLQNIIQTLSTEVLVTPSGMITRSNEVRNDVIAVQNDKDESRSDIHIATPSSGVTSPPNRNSCRVDAALRFDNGSVWLFSGEWIYCYRDIDQLSRGGARIDKIQEVFSILPPIDAAYMENNNIYIIQENYVYEYSTASQTIQYTDTKALYQHFGKHIPFPCTCVLKNNFRYYIFSSNSMTNMMTSSEAEYANTDDTYPLKSINPLKHPGVLDACIAVSANMDLFFAGIKHLVFRYPSFENVSDFPSSFDKRGGEWKQVFVTVC